MKRHPSLAPLSREHHGALILSQLLKKNAPAYKGMPTETDGKAIHATNFYSTHLEAHFSDEEKVLAALKGINTKLDSAINEIFEEHVGLRDLFETIKTTTQMESHLDLLGQALEKHIRKEERMVFPMIEEYVDAAIMARVENLLKH